MKVNSVGVIGGGAWGTALAQTQRLAGRDVLLWAREPETVEDINQRHVNRTFLPGIQLDESLRATARLREIAASDVILMVAPAQHVRAVCAELRPAFPPGSPCRHLRQGASSRQTGKLMGEVLTEALPDAMQGVLSGPSFASEVARGLPAALTIACRNEDLGRSLAEGLGYRQFRLYWSSDLDRRSSSAVLEERARHRRRHRRRQQVSAPALTPRSSPAALPRCAASANVSAAALKLCSACRAWATSLLTCGSPQSRNMSLGRALGEGRTLTDVLGSRVAVTEGVYTAAAVVRLAQQHGLEMPICGAVCAVLEGRVTVDDAIAALMQRPFKAED